MAQAGHQHRPQPVLEAQGEMPRISPLTPRETEVLRLVVSGLLNKEIADRLGVSLTTVISHRKNLTAKLGFRSVSALTIYAVTHGIAAVEEI
jgi:transcriptional regulator, luxR family domain protein